MITSESITNLSEALLKFHKEVRKIKKDANNPFFKSKYADLPTILDAISEPLNNNGLVLLQFPDDENMLTTRILHTSGEWMQSSFAIRPIPDRQKEKDLSGNVIWRSEEYVTPQAQGSAITYARRYSIAAILNLNIDEDDDGNAASGKAPFTVKPRPVATTAKPLLSKSQWSQALSRIGKGEVELATKLSNAYSLSTEQQSEMKKVLSKVLPLKNK